MPPAQFKDLCIDAVDARELGEFWAATLGLRMLVHDDGDAELVGPTQQHRVWVNQVPEPKTVKHRTHFDVYSESREAAEKLGATATRARGEWLDFVDPEGGELCIFFTKDPPSYRLKAVVVDCADHESQSAWWASIVGGEHIIDKRGYSYVERIPGAPFEMLGFIGVPEPKTVKNRIHLDLVSANVQAVLDGGATMLRERGDDIGWDVLSDPEGNEFCVFAPQSPP